VKFDCVVVGSHLRFDGVWQRPHHIVTRLARRVPVLYVEEPFVAETDADRIEPCAAVEVLRPARPRQITEIDGATVEAVTRWIAGRRALIWLYTPMMERLCDASDDVGPVYDRMDDLAAFAFAPAAMREREMALLGRARVVFAGGRTLYERCRQFGPKVHLVPSGVEFEHFSGATEIAPHPLFGQLGRPVCGYVGVIDERIDYAALAALADRSVELVLVGPVMKIDPAILPRRSNVHYTGQMPYGALPSLLAGFDVALLPFARNAATESISPTKTPEYLAAGKPVVSTRIADVVAMYDSVVTFADEPSAFAQACLAAAAGDPDRISRGIALAREMEWDPVVDHMVDVIERD